MMFCKCRASELAKERLLLMAESEPFENSSPMMIQLKKELCEVLERYLDISSDEYEIKLIRRYQEKRE